MKISEEPRILAFSIRIRHVLGIYIDSLQDTLRTVMISALYSSFLWALLPALLLVLRVNAAPTDSEYLPPSPMLQCVYMNRFVQYLPLHPSTCHTSPTYIKMRRDLYTYTQVIYLPTLTRPQLHQMKSRPTYTSYSSKREDLQTENASCFGLMYVRYCVFRVWRLE